VAEFFIPIEPKPAPRPRFTRQGRAYQPPQYNNYKDGLADWIMTNVQPVDYTAGHVSLTLRFCCTKPKTGKLEYPRGDLDNFAKGVMDAITDTEQFWRDDDQVISLNASKKYDAAPGIYCRIEPL
jgi:Holliday junction resolvase RusA-like endonuclease